MDPYTEYLHTMVTRNEPPYNLRQPRAARRSRAPRVNRWRLRLTHR